MNLLTLKTMHERQQVISTTPDNENVTTGNVTQTNTTLDKVVNWLDNPLPPPPADNHPDITLWVVTGVFLTAVLIACVLHL